MLVEVALPFRLPGTLTYELVSPEPVQPGSRLLVPLGRKQVIGCLLKESSSPSPPGLKRVTDLLDPEPLLTPLQMKLLLWASSYYLTPIGEVLRHLMPRSFFQPNGKSRKGKPLPDPTGFAPDRPVLLNADQKSAVEEIFSSSPPEPFLLEGITGSGKTEVYIELSRRLLKGGGQILVLVPEIALTPQLLGRFAAALGSPVLPYHSGLTDAQKVMVWTRVRTGESLVVVGTRSAIFLPLPRLAMIVVDEEHDASFKQSERFCYHARDLALWRGKEERLPVVLGSATPSLESIARCRRQKMRHLKLASRPGGATLPEVTLVDRRLPENRGHFLSEPLRQSLAANLKRGEQSLLFLNRRGFAPFVICPGCGYIPRCSSCEISLTSHQKGTRLICHYCDQTLEVPPLCPRCRRGSLAPEGVGTQRVEEELRSLFPRARLARLDRDSSTPEHLRKTLTLMREGGIDILIGTQTVAKGHDFPGLTLVGIVDADTALNLPDFRASERCYQLLTQVAGRAGRADKPGRVIVQTYHPEHASLVASLRQEGGLFYDQELGFREGGGYPPFWRLIRFLFAGRNEQQTRRAIHRFHDSLAEKFDIRNPKSEIAVLGPAPCPLSRIRNRWRWHLLVKSRDFIRNHPRLQQLLDEFSRNDLPSTVRMLADVDPVDMM